MKKDLLTRLNEGPIMCAEGYLFAMERRGYLSAGAFVPEVVLEHPEVVTQLHREFIRAGSDVVQAFTYYGHREKLRIKYKNDKTLYRLKKDQLRHDTGQKFWESLEISIRHNEAINGTHPVLTKLWYFWGNHFAISEKDFLAVKKILRTSFTMRKISFQSQPSTINNNSNNYPYRTHLRIPL